MKDDNSVKFSKEKSVVLCSKQSNIVNISNPFTVLSENNTCLQDINVNNNVLSVDSQDIPKDAGYSGKENKIENMVDKEIDKGIYVKGNSSGRVNNMNQINSDIHTEVGMVDMEDGDETASKSSLLEESDSSSSSFKRRRSKLKSNKFKCTNNMISEEPLVETNHEWVRLMSQYQTRSKSKRAKEGGGNPGGVMNGGITKR